MNLNNSIFQKLKTTVFGAFLVFATTLSSALKALKIQESTAQYGVDIS